MWSVWFEQLFEQLLQSVWFLGDPNQDLEIFYFANWISETLAATEILAYLNIISYFEDIISNRIIFAKQNT